MTDEYTKDPDVVLDEEYVRTELHGNEEFKPSNPERALPVTDEKPDLRETSFTTPGTFTEDEESLVTENKVSDLERIGDRDRQVAALVAASHRKGRTREEKLDSARKASALHEEYTGEPLIINEETGEIVTGPPISPEAA